jgi:hypothetical protein
MGVVMPRPRASHSRSLRGNVGPRRGTPPIASFPGSKITGPAARPEALEWNGFR